MNLQVLVAIAEIVSALAVTFTLIALIIYHAEHQAPESSSRFVGEFSLAICNPSAQTTLL
jgi:hypothetical protein